MTETEERPDQQDSEDLSQSPEKTDREDGGPTSADDAGDGDATGGATGTRPTEGFEPHE